MSDPDDNQLTHVKETEAIAYICSFSNNADSLDMWRYYSKDEAGVALRLVRSTLESTVKSKGFFNSDSDQIGVFNIYDVIYDDSQKIKTTEYLILKVIEKINNEKTDRKERSSKFAKDFNSIFWNKRFCFKHPCFKNEEEVRIVLMTPKDSSSIDTYGKKPYKIFHRTNNGMLIPYIEIDFPKKTLKEIKHSPISPIENIISTKSFIADFNDNIRVTQSSLPIRF